MILFPRSAPRGARSPTSRRAPTGSTSAAAARRLAGRRAALCRRCPASAPHSAQMARFGTHYRVLDAIARSVSQTEASSWMPRRQTYATLPRCAHRSAARRHSRSSALPTSVAPARTSSSRTDGGQTAGGSRCHDSVRSPSRLHVSGAAARSCPRVRGSRRPPAAIRCRGSSRLADFRWRTLSTRGCISRRSSRCPNSSCVGDALVRRKRPLADLAELAARGGEQGWAAGVTGRCETRSS